VFAFAGLWERWDKGEEPIESFTIIVTAANDFLRQIHDRMPVILELRECGDWFDTEGTPASAAVELLRSFPSERIEAYPVGTQVNRRANDDPELAEPIRQ